MGRSRSLRAVPGRFSMQERVNSQDDAVAARTRHCPRRLLPSRSIVPRLCRVLCTAIPAPDIMNIFSDLCSGDVIPRAGTMLFPHTPPFGSCRWMQQDLPGTGRIVFWGVRMAPFMRGAGGAYTCSEMMADVGPRQG